MYGSTDKRFLGKVEDDTVYIQEMMRIYAGDEIMRYQLMKIKVKRGSSNPLTMVMMMMKSST